MKTEELLIATLKEKAPAPTPDPDPDPDPNPDPKPNPDPVPEPDRPSSDKVNDQTNALMQSSIAAAATMFAADELLIDTTMKSRQGVRQTGPFAAARVGRYDLDVRGDLETNVISGLLGYAVNLQGSEIGAFVEMIENRRDEFDFDALYYCFPSEYYLRNDPSASGTLHEFYRCLPIFAEKAHIISDGDRISVAGADFSVFYTVDTAIRQNRCNNSSAVFRIEVGGKSILITGDCGIEAGNKIIAEYGDKIKSDIFRSPNLMK